MKYANFGNTGLVVSRLAFGAMTFGRGNLVGDLDTDLGQNHADRMVKTALDAGVNLFDTADMYTSGQSERILGRALGDRRHDALIATKCGFRAGEAITDRGLSHHHILDSVEKSLQRLGTDYIDLYILHIPDPFTPLDETARALDDVVRRGMVRYVAASNFPAWKAQKLLDRQTARGSAGIVALQMYYSLLGRDIEADVVPFLRDNGLGLMAWSPLASGFLSGKYTRGNPVPDDARRARFDFPPVDVEKGYAVVDKLREMANRRDASPAAVALAWVLAKPFVSTVLVGANRPEQLSENLKAADVALSSDEVAELDEMTAPRLPYPAWMQSLGWEERVCAGLGVSRPE
jgi:aryl-alcohol dehydrogenase-like predicted oxidoreductase